MKKIWVIGLIFSPVLALCITFPVTPDTSETKAKKQYLQVGSAPEGAAYTYQFPAVVPVVKVKIPPNPSWSVPYSPCFGNSLENVEGAVKRWGDTLLVIYKNEEGQAYCFRYFDLAGSPLSSEYSIGEAERVWGFKHNLDPGKGVILFLHSDTLYLSEVAVTGILETHPLLPIACDPQFMDVSSLEPDTLFPTLQRISVVWVENNQVKVQNFNYFDPISPVIIIHPGKTSSSKEWSDFVPQVRAFPDGVGVLVYLYQHIGPALYRGLSWSGENLGDPIWLSEVIYEVGFRFLMDFLIEGSPLQPDWIVLTGAYHIWVDPEPSCTWGIPALYVYTGNGECTFTFSFYHHTCFEYASFNLNWISPDTFSMTYITPTDWYDASNQLIVKKFPIGEDWIDSVELDDEMGNEQSSPLLSIPQDNRIWVLWEDGGRYKVRAFDHEGNPLTSEIDDGRVEFGYPYGDWTLRRLSSTLYGVAIGWYAHWSGFPGSSNELGLMTLNLEGEETSDHILCMSNYEYCSLPLISSCDSLIAVAWSRDTSSLKLFDPEGNLLISSEIPYLPKGIELLDDGNILTVSREDDSLALRVMAPEGEWITDYQKLIPIGEYFSLRTSRVEEGKYLVAVRIRSDYTHGDYRGFYYYWPEDSVEPVFSIENTEWSFATTWNAAGGPGLRLLVVWVKDREGPCGVKKDIWKWSENIPSLGEGWLFDEATFERNSPQVEIGDSTLFLAWEQRDPGAQNSDVYVMVENLGPVNVEGPHYLTEKSKFRVLQNPTRGFLSLSLPPLPPGSHLEVFNLAGRRVFDYPISLCEGGKVYLPLKLPSGNYFVEIRSKGKRILGPLTFSLLR